MSVDRVRRFQLFAKYALNRRLQMYKDDDDDDDDD
jgi:hypothetical protein